jgi:hypothetical protein
MVNPDLSDRRLALPINRLVTGPAPSARTAGYDLQAVIVLKPPKQITGFGVSWLSRALDISWRSKIAFRLVEGPPRVLFAAIKTHLGSSRSRRCPGLRPYRGRSGKRCARPWRAKSPAIPIPCPRGHDKGISLRLPLTLQPPAPLPNSAHPRHSRFATRGLGRRRSISVGFRC